MELLFGTFFLVLGALLGSFVGVVAERAYTGQTFLKGRSRCNSCARPLTGRDLVPVLSWLASKGKCFVCKARVPGAYALLEGSLGLLFLASYLMLGLTPALFVFLLSLLVLAFIVVYDLRHTVVPTAASNALLALGVLMTTVTYTSVEMLSYTYITAGAIGLFFFLMHALSKGRAMGLGDAPVALALSLLIAPYAVSGLLFSFWIGAVVGIGILVMRSGGPRMGIEVPFVPFLAAGYLTAYFLSWNLLTLILL